MGCGASLANDPVHRAFVQAKRDGKLRRRDLDRLWDLSDEDKSGTLDEREFNKMVVSACQVQFNRLKRVFNETRKNVEEDLKARKVSPAESAVRKQQLAARLKNVESHIEANLKDLKSGKSEIVKKVADTIDSNKDGLINKKEFCNPNLKRLLWDATGIDQVEAKEDTKGFNTTV